MTDATEPDGPIGPHEPAAAMFGDVLAKLSADLKRLRAEGDWDRLSVARGAHRSVTQLAEYEAGRFGKRGPTLHLLCGLAVALESELVVEFRPRATTPDR